MNENAKKWVAALRSGEFTQGTGRLVARDPDTNEVIGHCCLGVACVLAQRATGVGFVERELPPRRVQRWLGLSTVEGTIEGDFSLVEHNDNNGVTFDEIADLIESEPEGLFI